MKRLILPFIIIIMVLTVMSVPATAISNPTQINFGSNTNVATYKVFENVLETGDMLFVAEGLVDYTTTPTDYTASQAFNFEVLNVAGNQTLLSVPLNAYGDRPISIYQTAAQVTSDGLVSGSNYIFRIAGNPLIFPSMSGNSVNATLVGSNDYVDQSVATDSNNPLRDFLMGIAINIEAYDAPTTSYLTTVQGTTYLSTGGASIFIQGIPGLYNMCPILFQTSASNMQGDTPSSNGAYGNTLTAVSKWNQLTANGLTNIGLYLGLSPSTAGSVVLFLMVIALGVFIYQKTQSGITVLLMVATTPFVGAYLGLMSIALAFIFTISVVILMMYYFWSRGAL